MKHDEPTLFGAGRTIVDGKPLASRQQTAWDELRRRGRMTEDELGAVLHAQRGKHSEDTICKWCQKEGAGVLRSQALRTLVTRKRTGYWEPRDPADSLAETLPPAPEPTRTSERTYAPLEEEIPW